MRTLVGAGKGPSSGSEVLLRVCRLLDGNCDDGGDDDDDEGSDSVFESMTDSGSGKEDVMKWLDGSP